MADEAMMGPNPTPASTYDPRAHGFTGEHLDYLMRAAFTEGVQEEEERQSAVRRQAMHVSYQEGLKRGLAEGRASGRSEYGKQVQEKMHMVVNTIENVRNRLTGGTLRKHDREALIEKLRQAHTRADTVRWGSLNENA